MLTLRDGPALTFDPGTLSLDPFNTLGANAIQLFFHWTIFCVSLKPLLTAGDIAKSPHCSFTRPHRPVHPRLSAWKQRVGTPHRWGNFASTGASKAEDKNSASLIRWCTSQIYVFMSPNDWLNSWRSKCLKNNIQKSHMLNLQITNRIHGFNFFANAGTCDSKTYTIQNPCLSNLNYNNSCTSSA